MLVASRELETILKAHFMKNSDCSLAHLEMSFRLKRDEISFLETRDFARWSKRQGVVGREVVSRVGMGST